MSKKKDQTKEPSTPRPPAPITRVTHYPRTDAERKRMLDKWRKVWGPKGSMSRYPK